MSFSFSLPRENGVDSETTALELSIDAAIDAGMHVAVAAGNDGNYSCDFAPAFTGGANGRAISVGSISIYNTISSFSNTGDCTDIYAPGEQVMSAWISGKDVINILDGTSMATPHVAGVVAYLMSQNETLAKSPVEMKKFLLDTAIRGQITGQVYQGDNMLLLNNGVVTS